ncbi:MAG: hypothetical protein KAJ07_06045 [Planctomycetes bacterium]|nr:hypothetical protein [Planctomycetota bacterium]
MGIASPFNAVHERLGANFKDYHGWSLPSDYGNAQAEADALTDGCCAFDLSSFGKIEIKGTDGGTLLETLTGQKPGPADNKWIWAKIADAGNEIIARVSNTAGGYIVFTLPEDRQNIVTLIHRRIEENSLTDVTIADITEKTGMLGIYGPKAVEVIGKLVPFDISGIGENGVMNVSLFMISATIVRGSWIGCDGYEVLCPSIACGMAAGAVEKYHKKEGITPAGMDCLLGKIAKNVESIRKNV